MCSHNENKVGKRGIKKSYKVNVSQEDTSVL